MFHQDYLRLKALKCKLSEKIENRKNNMNQDIHVRDIIVTAVRELYAFGEYNEIAEKYKNIPIFERMIDHVKALALIATEYHHQYNCQKNEDDGFTIKKDCLNKITRLSLHEFFLYTETPLKMEDIGAFVEEVGVIAKNQPANVHLLLSSICVVTEDDKLLNISFYVQCGPEPKMETICKARSFAGDPDYENIVSFDQQDMQDKKFAISAYIASATSSTIATNSLLFVKTQGGAEYVQAIDICLDHRFQHSKYLMINLLCAGASNNSFLIPGQVDHILTSNCYKLSKKDVDARLSTRLFQVDPRVKYNAVQNDVMAIENIQKIKSSKYADLDITKTRNSFVIRNPAFGGDYKVVVMEERKLGGFSDSMKGLIDDKNANTIKYKIKSVLDSGSQHNSRVNDCKENEKKSCLIK